MADRAQHRFSGAVISPLFHRAYGATFVEREFRGVLVGLVLFWGHLSEA